MVSDVVGAQAALIYQNGQGSGDSEYVASSTQGAGSVDSSSHKSIASRSKAASLGRITGRKSTNGINGRDTANATNTENGHQDEDLWSGILNSVKSSRAVPVKNIIILGEGQLVSESILMHYLLTPSFRRVRDREIYASITTSITVAFWICLLSSIKS
jgi:hypothetical protein